MPQPPKAQPPKAQPPKAQPEETEAVRCGLRLGFRSRGLGQSGGLTDEALLCFAC